MPATIQMLYLPSYHAFFLLDSLQQSFFRVLNQRLLKMEDIRTLLSTLVHNVDRKIAGGDYLLR
jgi:hypothetical protein